MAEQRMQRPLELDEHLTLSQAAKLAPGRPSSNCLWRWCRRGVLSRAGERIYLQHVRVGGKVYTRVEWIENFARTLAAADNAYFRKTEDDASQRAARSKPKRRRKRFEQHRRDTMENANQELDDAGL